MDTNHIYPIIELDVMVKWYSWHKYILQADKLKFVTNRYEALNRNKLYVYD